MSSRDGIVGETSDQNRMWGRGGKSSVVVSVVSVVIASCFGMSSRVY
jgi:hypothetical protein